MTPKRMTDVSGTEFQAVWSEGEDFILKDYRGQLMTSVARRDELSNFTVVVVNSWRNIYGQVFLFGTLFIVIYIISVLPPEVASGGSTKIVGGGQS